MTIQIRPITIEDAPAYLDMLCQIDEETKFMMFEPGERPRDEDAYRKRIDDSLASDNSMIFVVEDLAQNKLVGFLGASGGRYRRIHHTVHIVIGMLEAYTGQGIGQRLFEVMETWARGWDANRLELTVMANNARAVALYKKMGFKIEGTRRHAMRVDGAYVDEYAMSKILE